MIWISRWAQIIDNSSAWLGRLSLAILALVLAFVHTGRAPVAEGSVAPRWSLSGAWTGVAADERSATSYALGRGGRLAEVDANGRIVRSIALTDERGSLLRLARVGGPPRPALLTFSVWSNQVHAYAVDGRLLWSYPEGGLGGIDDVGVGVSGTGAAEVIVGFNGPAGLHVLNDRGQLLWKTTEIGNVWHVASGDVWGFGGTQVVTTSATGLVHVFREGGRSPSIRLPVERRPPAPIVPPTYATMVRVGKASKTDKAATMFVVGERPMKGPGPVTEHVVALSLVGGKEWTLELPTNTSRPHVDSAALASGQPWLAVGLRGGRVHVVDVAQARIIGTIDDQGSEPEVGWAGSESSAPLLLVATGAVINAFSVLVR